MTTAQHGSVARKPEDRPAASSVQMQGCCRGSGVFHNAHFREIYHRDQIPRQGMKPMVSLELQTLEDPWVMRVGAGKAERQGGS